MSTETHSIAVGLDGSTQSLEAVGWAAHEAILRSASLTLMTWPEEVAPSLTYYAVPQSYFTELEESARDTLREGEETAAAVGSTAGHVLEIDTELMSGYVRPGLMEASKSVDLLVVGTRGQGAVMSELVGSVTSALAEHASCPVVVIHDEAMSQPLTGPVVVGVDGSESSAVATAIAFSEASLRGTGLIAVHAFHDRAPRVESGSVLSSDDVKQLETAALTERLAGHRARYPDVPVTVKAVAGGPVPVLQSACDGAALVVVGSRGRGGFMGLLLGSTSRALLHSVTSPLMIVHVG